MAELTKTEMLRIVDENISRLKNKDFNLYFFVIDTKGNPVSTLEYIYQTAYILKEKGYNVTLLHQDKEFIGVSDWLGEKYSNLPHANIETDNVEITPSDFIFIPEIFANVMMQTKKLPCKRVVIVQNYNHITEFMPVSQTYENLNITDVITTTKTQEEKVKEWFPYVRTHVVSPSIKPMFRESDKPKKLIVNVISKDQSLVNQIVKPFYWKNPLYKWVTFRDLRGVNQDTFCEALREAAITIWIDDNTNFGLTLLESLRCGSIVLAKVPNNPTEWMLKDGELTDSVLWFNNVDDIHNMLTSVVRSWTMDNIPEEVYESQRYFNNLFTEEVQANEIESVYIKNIIEKRLKDFEETKIDVENNVIKSKEE
jgi:hypothetical protein